tara:strand:+ start:156 stop:536 length:381 start_codon:yes stop_codon:yes gene_type:complete
MSHFLADAYKKTITLKQDVYSQIVQKERHHITLSKANLEINDVVVFQSESDEMMNAKHPSSSKETWAMFTTKESYSLGGKTLCVYGFITLESLPQKLITMANKYYLLNAELVKEQIEALDIKVDAL